MPPSSSSHEDESPPSLSDDAIEEEVTKLRISLVLSPSYVRGRENDLRVDALRLPADPIAVPATIRKRGLSAVVNHLLDRRVPTENDDDDDDDDDDDEDKLPAIPFDFLLNDKLLRLPLDSAARKEGLSTERALVVHYFPARPPPSRVGGGETEALPDWITAMDYRCRRQDGVGGTLFVGGADGIVRTFVSSPPPPSGGGGGLLRRTCSASAHAGPIQCLAVSPSDEDGGALLVATGSMDQTLVTHVLRPVRRKEGEEEEGDGGKGGETIMGLHAVYSGGHANSVGSVALSGDGATMASGDWDGGLSLWSVPRGGRGADAAADDVDAVDPRKRRRRGGAIAVVGRGDEGGGGGGVREVRPLASIRAHSSNVSGLAWCHGSTTSLITGSWDHGLKVYDVNRMDCVLTLNGSRVVSTMGRCSNSNVVATGSPDCTVRLWDMRTNGGGGGGNVGMDKSLRQR